MNTSANSAVVDFPAPVLNLCVRIQADLARFDAELADVDGELKRLELRRQELIERANRTAPLRQYLTDLLAGSVPDSKDSMDSGGAIPPLTDALPEGARVISRQAVWELSKKHDSTVEPRKETGLRKRTASPKSVEALQRVNSERKAKKGKEAKTLREYVADQAKEPDPNA